MSNEIFDKLYEDIDGMGISWEARNKLKEEEIEHLIYGEMSYNSLSDILNEKKIKNYISNCSNLCDLGSGTGRIVIGSSLILDNLKSCSGIEILKELYDTSNEVVKKYSKINEEKAKKINFINDNFFNVDLSKYDLIFMHYPMKTADDLYLQLEEKMKKELKKDSVVISVIEWLKDEDVFKKIAVKTVDCDYSNSTVRYYVKY